MGTIYDNLRQHANVARKTKNQNQLETLQFVIGTLQSEATMTDEGKVVSDEVAINTMRNIVKKLDETATIKSENGLTRDKELAEIELINSFLPAVLTEEQLVAVIEANSFTKVGEYMSFLKQNYSGLYDGKVASQIWKNHASI